MKEEMVERMSIEHFRESGLMWWTNRFLHLFGVTLAVSVEDGKPDFYPAWCKYRGFPEESETRGFGRLTKFLEENFGRMKKDCE